MDVQILLFSETHIAERRMSLGDHLVSLALTLCVYRCRQTDSWFHLLSDVLLDVIRLVVELQHGHDKAELCDEN